MDATRQRPPVKTLAANDGFSDASHSNGCARRVRKEEIISTRRIRLMNQSRLQDNVAVILPQAARAVRLRPSRADDLCDSGKVVFTFAAQRGIERSMPGNVICPPVNCRHPGFAERGRHLQSKEVRHTLALQAL